MSKRNSSTYTEVVRDAEGKKTLVRHCRPITKGLALVAARDLLGGEARVSVRGNDLFILCPNGGLAGSGRTWETAIAEAGKAKAAQLTSKEAYEPALA